MLNCYGGVPLSPRPSGCAACTPTWPAGSARTACWPRPGRAVTAYCGWYLTRVLDVKHSHGEAFAVVAGGTHHLRTPAAKGHDQPFAVIGVDEWAPAWPRPGVRGEAVTIAGKLCTPKDVLARRVRVGRLRALRIGDLVAFGLAGAYAWNISHHGFRMHPPPAFHYLP
jgi:diaminopimelate decarboxylase